MSEIESFAPGSGRRVQPRSRVASDAPEIDLSGTWRFRFSARPDLAPEGAAAPDFDDSAWDEIPVPSHWVLQGRDDWGRPAYTNVNFPFPVEPPFVPPLEPDADSSPPSLPPPPLFSSLAAWLAASWATWASS